jgi:hypothetical protein
MINTQLHRQPVPVDSNQHRATRLRMPVSDWSVASRLNATFVAAVEFGDVAREYAIVFARAGDDEGGKPAIAPIAVLGMVQNDNLYVEGGSWRARYIPAVVASYPFAIARLDAQRFAVCLDAAWAGVSVSDGDALFNADGSPSDLLKNAQAHLERIEVEVQRTRHLCRRLRDLDLLRDMRFDATLPDGTKLAVDGFLTVDDAKLNALPDATLLELQRNGLLGLVHAHLLSLGHMHKLRDWHVARLARPAV